ncbi:MAG TPA: SpoIIE family protein phosphatase, partial [Nocardioides sp.]|nr:SpoIIE family protein phosphatase [Nocardioides sp.]
MHEVFGQNGGVARDLEAVDWTATALGDPGRWPPSLRTAVRIMLASRFSMWMGWGPELTFFCNDAYRRDTLGAKYPWALGRPTREVWAEIWTDIEPRVQRVLARGESTWDERLLLFLERNGYREETYHTFSYSPIADDHGGTAGLLCVVAEVTEEVVAQRRIDALRSLGSALAHQHTVDQTVHAASGVLSASAEDLPFHLVYLYDDEGRAGLVSSGHVPAGHPAAPQVLVGADGEPWSAPQAGDAPVVEDRLGRRYADLPTGRWDQPPSAAAVVPVQATQGASYGFLVVGLNPFRPYDGEYAGFLSLLGSHLGAAITDARAYEFERERAETLAELDRAKTDFFTNVSHEFRTPLTLLLGPVEDALSDAAEPLPPGQRERLDIVRRNALRLLKLVNSLLTFSRLESGRVEARFEPVDLAAYTRDLASMFRAAAERLGLELEIDCPPLPGPVHVDPELWADVVLNLLSNALKFTFEGGITVSLRGAGERAALSVRDTGIGIPSDQQPSLFQRFHRVPQARSRSHEGSGIGLALVAEVVALHGGEVTVDSKPGSGSSFEVLIPFGRDHLPPEQVVAATGARLADRLVEGFVTETQQFVGAAGPVADEPAPPGDRARVLVVDDNGDVRQYVARVLAAEFDVETAVDGRDALERAAARLPDLVLTDVMMPRLDGFGLLAELRADPATMTVPVVMLSARGGEEATVVGLDAGADDYLVKPFAARELLARVRANLELDRNRRIRAELERGRELLEQAQRLAHVGSWSMDLSTGRLDASPELLRLVERSHSELEGAGHPGFLADLAHPDERQFIRTVLLESRPGEEFGFEVLMTRADRSTFHAYVRGEVVTSPGGGAVVRGSLQDVTERRRTEESIVSAQATAEVAAREHQIAAELQRSLLPERTFELTHLEVATFYRPGQEGTQVGGDWYDVIELAGGRTALVMGDVMGHGVHAAAVMGQLRTAVRAYARLGMPPRALMESVDDLVRELFPDQIATCVYAEFDPASLTLSVVNAGHVPLLVAAGGATTCLKTHPHPPLGVARPFGDPETVQLSPGDTVLLYTDGLVERRDRDVVAGIELLMETAAAVD